MSYMSSLSSCNSTSLTTSSLIRPALFSLNSVCRTRGILSFRGHCFRWGFCLSSLWTLVAPSLSPSLLCGTLRTSLLILQTPSQWQHLAWPSDLEQAFLIRSRIMLVSLVIIINFSCDKIQHSEKPTLNIQTPTAEKSSYKENVPHRHYQKDRVAGLV